MSHLVNGVNGASQVDSAAQCTEAPKILQSPLHTFVGLKFQEKAPHILWDPENTQKVNFKHVPHRSVGAKNGLNTICGAERSQHIFLWSK